MGQCVCEPRKREGDNKLRNLQRASISNAFNGQRARRGYSSTMRTKGTTRRCAASLPRLHNGGAPQEKLNDRQSATTVLLA
jgi:hypothetical protein